MKTPTQEEIRAKAREYKKDFADARSIAEIFTDGYTQALTDMQQPVDVEALRQKFDSEMKEYDMVNVWRDKIFNWFLPYLQQPAPQSDAVEWNVGDKFKCAETGNFVIYMM